ncbi:hypothetical protein C8F04DRAFT_1063116 [Mycena alexandri]|uniref:Uncharacterized protein n=1 Tax=Mycena alexandri TaxID=1745969 RepID=A0AAD6XGI3_9AGAR|nr:hypothetical protein C8F04DRAFT_1063116 [Mycena alexandri]
MSRLQANSPYIQHILVSPQLQVPLAFWVLFTPFTRPGSGVGVGIGGVASAFFALVHLMVSQPQLTWLVNPSPFYTPLPSSPWIDLFHASGCTPLYIFIVCAGCL